MKASVISHHFDLALLILHFVLDTDNFDDLPKTAWIGVFRAHLCRDLNSVKKSNLALFSIISLYRRKCKAEKNSSSHVNPAYL